MKRFILLSLLIAISAVSSQAQRNIQETIALNWADAPIVHQTIEGNSTEIWQFEGAIFDDTQTSLPIYMYSFPLKGNSQLEARLSNPTFERIALKKQKTKGTVAKDIKIIATVEKDRRDYVAKITLVPIRAMSKSSYEKLVSATLNISIKPISGASFRGPTNTTTSVLGDGTIYKIAVTNTGVHKITATFLSDELGIDITSLNPNALKIYGAGSGMLPEANNVERIDDLVEIPVEIVAGNDGNFDADDHILFYGEGSDKWRFNADNQLFSYEKNIYDTRNFYFIKIGNQNSKPIATRNSIDNTSYTSTSFDALAHYEEDRVNLLHDYTLGQGSGKNWYGDLFEVTRERTYNEFEFPNIITSAPAKIKTSFVGRGRQASQMGVSVAGQTFLGSAIAKVSTGDPEARHGNISTVNKLFTPTGTSLPVTISYYENAGTSQGWLDYIEIQVKRQLSMVGNALRFRDLASLAHDRSTFRLDNASNKMTIWDVSDPLNPIRQETNLVGSQMSFGVETAELKEFIAFDRTSNLATPTAVGQIANQNIHAIDDIDLLIIYPTVFEAQAMQFAEHRRQHSQLNVATVLITEIYNEFSSGRKDPSAIRDFARMLHLRNDRFKYLLLFGDGSFDARNIYSFEQSSNFIPVFEHDSLNPISSFPSDDYYTLLSDDEGKEDLQGMMDIAIGRFTVKTTSEAQTIVNKIIKYDTNPIMLDDWRNRLLFVADDGDSNIHAADAEGIADYVDNTYNQFNIDKIYLDAYPQVSTPAGEKFPTVTEALNRSIFQGNLVVNYLGHGGSKGWTQERVLRIQDIDNWTNNTRLPLVVTATCSFSGYDDPAFVTAGERVFLNPQGGAVGLFTTVRAVFASTNEQLTRAVFKQIFEKENGAYNTVGEVLRRSKNMNTGNSFTTNSRKFTLLGDPSMELALPEYQVATTHINGNAVTIGESIDTIRAFQEVTIAGQIQDDAGNLKSDFNGTVFPTVFDKNIQLLTLGQDNSPFNFNLQKNVLFKGLASVTNGLFEFTFIVPKDINYTFGNGKVSYYAKDNGTLDATGFYDQIVVGGTSSVAIADDEGPQVEVFMNNEEFVFGGVTNEKPMLYVQLSDNNGINVAGSSVGHDLTAVLDGDTQNSYLLNDFYESALNDYSKGEVRFPLANIPAGRHSILVKAWDVANNPAEGYTEFVVARSEEAALEHVLNYPNPFTTNTNFQFEHNLADQLLNVQVRIFTVAGKLVKTIDKQLLSDGYRVTDIAWNGTDDFGDRLARGVYLYKIKIDSADATLSTKAIESDFEKLVLLK